MEQFRRQTLNWVPCCLGPATTPMVVGSELDQARQLHP